MAVKITDPLRSDAVNIVRQCLGGTGGITGTNGSAAILKVYAGDFPSTAGATSGTQAILVQINFIGWKAASNGTALLGTSYPGTAINTGVPNWGRMSDYTGTGYIIDGVCGTATTCDFKISSSSMSPTDVITLTVASIVQPASE